MAYTGNLVDRYNNSITEEGWFMHISASGFTSPFGTFGSFNLFTCVDEECRIFDPVAPVLINDKFMDPPLPAGSYLLRERMTDVLCFVCFSLPYCIRTFDLSRIVLPRQKKDAIQRALT